MQRSLSPFYRESASLEVLSRLPEGLNNQRSEVKARVTVAGPLFRSPCTQPHYILCHWMTSKQSDRDHSLPHSIQLASKAGSRSVEGRALQTGSYLWYIALCELPSPQEMGLGALALQVQGGKSPFFSLRGVTTKTQGLFSAMHSSPAWDTSRTG